MVRATSRRDIQRTSTAIAIILVMVLALALAAVLGSVRATRNLHRAETAEAAARERLWHAYVAQARSVRLTPEAGRRQHALTVISNAAAIQISPGLRSEAIAALALSDIDTVGEVRPAPRDTVQVEMDATLTLFAHGDSQGNVLIGRLADGITHRTFAAQELGLGTRMPVRSVAFDPEGRKLAARFEGGAMVVWDVATGARLLASGVNATNLVIAGMSFWPDANRLSYGDADANGQIALFDFDSGEIVRRGIRVGARTFRFRPGTMEVAVATDAQVDLYAYPDGRKLATLETATRVFTMAWSPDGSQLAVATEDGDVYLWSIGRHGQRILRGHSEPCVRLGFSPDGAFLFSGSRDGTTRLWDAALGQTIVSAHEGVGHIFSNDGERIGFWRPSVGFGVWRLSRSEIYRQLVCPKADGAFLSVDLSPSGRWCLATQSKGFRLWDLAGNEPEVFVEVEDLVSARIAPDERSLYLCRRSGLEVWPFDGNSKSPALGAAAIRRISLPEDRGARALAVSLAGHHAVVELTDARLVVLNLTTEEAPVFLGEKCRFASLRSPASPTGAGRFAISPDGRWVVTGFGVGEGDHPKVWDARTGEKIITLNAPSSVVAFSADGRLLGTAGTAASAIWSVGDWNQLQKMARDEPAITHGSLAFLGDGSDMVVTRTRQQAQLRATFTDEVYANLIAPQPQSVSSVRMALDGSVIVTASATDKLQVWHMDRARQQLALIGLDWKGTPPIRDEVASLPAGVTPVQVTLFISLAGFGLASAFALLTLRRHRAAIVGFLVAERRAAQRNRELEVAKVELMHSQKMQALGTLATGIAHDFNNLLSVIRMSNKLIGRETRNQPDIQENVADIEQAVMQGKNVVSSMLGYARNESISAAAKLTDVSAVVEETVSLLSKEFLSGIALTLELDREAPSVNVGRGRLEQVLLNLVVNASEAMQGQGRLTISVHTRTRPAAKPYALRPADASQYVEMTVVDSGPGIAPEVQARLFEPFFTTKRTSAKAGTGLGLSLVYSIAQQDGLGLSVESEAGKGATFTLVIPVPVGLSPVRETHSSQTRDSP